MFLFHHAASPFIFACPALHVRQSRRLSASAQKLERSIRESTAEANLTQRRHIPLAAVSKKDPGKDVFSAEHLRGGREADDAPFIWRCLCRFYFPRKIDPSIRFGINDLDNDTGAVQLHPRLRH